MKRLLLISIFFTLLISLSGQKVILRINEPSANKGNLKFIVAEFGSSLNTGIIHADAICAEPLIACRPLDNAAAMQGKIAIIGRGTCSFMEKCINAQNAGAVAIIIYNNIPLAGPFVMTGTNPNITIPCVTISTGDGELLKSSCLSGEKINISIGFLPRQENDLAIYIKEMPLYSEPYVFNPPWGAIPFFEINKLDEFFLSPIVHYKNEGIYPRDNIQLSVEISRNATELNSQSISDQNPLDVDSIKAAVFKSIDLASLPSKDMLVGKYNINYKVGNTLQDSIEYNNIYGTFFNVTQNIYSKGRFDMATKTGLVSQYWGGNEHFYKLVLPIYIRNGKYATIDSLFTAVASDGPLANSGIEVGLYKFTDFNNDGNVSNEELEIVAVGYYLFPNDYSSNIGNQCRMKLESLVGNPNSPYMIDEDDALYFASLCPLIAHTPIYFGFDSDFSQRSYFRLKESFNKLEVKDYPYLAVSSELDSNGNINIFNGDLFFVDANGDGVEQDEEIAFFAPTIALELNRIIGNDVDLSGNLDIPLELSPVPVKDNLVATFSLPEATKVNYQIITSNGQLVFDQDEQVITKDFKTTFNLSSLPVGTYFLRINTSKGFIKKAFIKL